jgi:hypothetical protein
MATDKPIDVKILIFPGILAVCAMVALTWFPPKIAQQEAVLSPTEIPVAIPTEIPNAIQAPATEIEPVNTSGDNLNLLNNDQEIRKSHLTTVI